MLLNHIAYYAADQDCADRIVRFFGLEREHWVTDYVTADIWSNYDGIERSGVLKMKLMFNYTFGSEVEIIQITEGARLHMHWPDIQAGKTCIFSHHGIKLEDDEDFPSERASVIQEVKTTHHTNPYLQEKRRLYHYKYYNTQPLFGDSIEYIKRIENAY